MRTARLFVDAHVHIHECFDLPRFFLAAFRNFSRASGMRPEDAPHISVLMLTEGGGQRVFRNFAEAVKDGRGRLGDAGRDALSMFPTMEEETIRVQGSDGKSLFLVSGFQIATAERMEVLALGTCSDFPDGSKLDETVASVMKDDAIAVLPWGFGKWSGKRGETLRRFLEDPPSPGLFLGDNGGRTGFLPMSSLFAVGRRKGIRVLPGSDPLPFPSEHLRPGSYGFTLRAPVDLERPLLSIRTALLGASAEPEPYGRLTGPIRFLRNQVAMQLKRY